MKKKTIINLLYFPNWNSEFFFVQEPDLLIFYSCSIFGFWICFNFCCFCHFFAIFFCICIFFFNRIFTVFITFWKYGCRRRQREVFSLYNIIILKYSTMKHNMNDYYFYRTKAFLDDITIIFKK